MRCLQREQSGNGAATTAEVFPMQRSRLCRKARSGLWGDLRFLLGLGLDRRSLGLYHLMISPMVGAQPKKGPRPLSISAKGQSRERVNDKESKGSSGTPNGSLEGEQESGP